MIGLSHADYVAIRATRRVPDDYKPTIQKPLADDSTFTVVLARVFDLDGGAFEDGQRIFEVKPALGQSLRSLGWTIGQMHPDNVSTKTIESKSGSLCVLALIWPNEAKAVTAAGHKLARMVDLMLTRGEEYVDQGRQSYEEHYHERVVRYLAKEAAELGLQLTPANAPTETHLYKLVT